MKASLKAGAWTDVAVFEKFNDGQALETFLKQRRLEAQTYDDKIFRYCLFLRPPRITYRVQVRRNALRAAEELLGNTPEAATLLARALHCPDCGSLRVSYPQMTRKFFTPTVLLHLGIIFRVIDHECYCEHCHCVWNLPRPEKRRDTVLKNSPMDGV